VPNCGEGVRSHAIRFRAIRFRTSDGLSLSGAVVGSGAVGGVLIHEYPLDLCGWWPYAGYLSRHGVQALGFDVRCFGTSPCPGGPRVTDVAAAVAELSRRGARRVTLVGASMGGAERRLVERLAGSRVADGESCVVKHVFLRSARRVPHLVNRAIAAASRLAVWTNLSSAGGAERHEPALLLGAEPESAPANALGMRGIMFAVEDIDDASPACAATTPSWSAISPSTRTAHRLCFLRGPRASSSDWPSSSPEQAQGAQR
jgi:pimeloyl-ACP methyl ester carboxylesterase